MSMEVAKVSASEVVPRLQPGRGGADKTIHRIDPINPINPVDIIRMHFLRICLSRAGQISRVDRGGATSQRILPAGTCICAIVGHGTCVAVERRWSSLNAGLVTTTIKWTHTLVQTLGGQHRSKQ
jgi:hypothetical protein